MTDGSPSRLERALRLWLEHQSDDSDTDDNLLARHPDLGDLLEPLLARDSARSEHPRRLGDFELVREIGRGGMGVVYEARQRSLDRRVAVKVLTPELTANPGAVARLRREAMTAARLNHGNLVKVLGLGCEGTTHFLARELVEGEPIDCEERTPIELAELGAQVADALQCAHDAGIVHRDVKPANILVTAAGVAMLTDFGLARDPLHPSWSQLGTFAGTPDYASPEQLRGEPVDGRSDVFALGATLFELLTGERPFAGATPAAMLERIRSAAPPDLRAIRRELPRELSAIVQKAIAPRAADRYASARALAADLRAFGRGAPVMARPARVATRVVRWARREPWRAAAVAVLAIAVPAIAGLVGHWIATAPMVRAGEALARDEQVERVLADAYLALSVGDRAAAGTHLSAALAVAPEHGEARAIARLLADPRDQAAGASTEDPVVATLATAVRHMLDVPTRPLRASAHELGDRRAARAALPSVSLAARLAPRPRLPLYTLFGSLAGVANSEAHSKDAAEVLARLWPDVLAARRARCRAMRVLEPARAIELMRDLVAEHPDDVALRFELVGYLCRNGDRQAAIEESRPLVALAGTDPMAHVCLAEHLLKADQAEAAIAPYRRALELEPNDAMTRYNLAVALDAANHAEDALAEYRRVVERADVAPAWNNLSALLLQRGELDEALRTAARAVAADPELANASRSYRDAAEQHGRFDLQWAELSRWIARKPEDLQGQIDAATFLLHHGIAAGHGTARDALRFALRAFAQSGFRDNETAELVASAWRRLGDPLAAAIVIELATGGSASGR